MDAKSNVGLPYISGDFILGHYWWELSMEGVRWYHVIVLFVFSAVQEIFGTQ
jgi:hypothetical protein